MYQNIKLSSENFCLVVSFLSRSIVKDHLPLFFCHLCCLLHFPQVCVFSHPFQEHKFKGVVAELSQNYKEDWQRKELV